MRKKIRCSSNMHLYLITRGIKHDVDRFINDLRGKYLPFKFRGENTMVQVAVRPIQLWEIVFPKEYKDLMLRSILENNQGKTQHKKHQKYITILRKILGIKKIPKYDGESIERLPLYLNNVEKIGIGIKEDKNLPDGTEGL